MCTCAQWDKKENPEFNSPERLFLLVTDFGGKREKEKWKEAIGLANIDFLYFSWHKWSETASTNLFSVCYSPYSYQRFQYGNLNPRLYNTISACVHISSQFFPILFPSSSFHLSIICRECRRLSIVTYIHISSYNIYISNILNFFWWWARDLLDVRICDGFFVSIHFVCFKASKMIDNDLNFKRIKIFIIIKSFILDTFVCYGIQTFAFL